jgi:hypothetical protein
MLRDDGRLLILASSLGTLYYLAAVLAVPANYTDAERNPQSC